MTHDACIVPNLLVNELPDLRVSHSAVKGKDDFMSSIVPKMVGAKQRMMLASSQSGRSKVAHDAHIIPPPVSH